MLVFPSTVSGVVDVDSSQERLVTGATGRLSVTLAVGILVVNVGRQGIPPLLPRIIEELAITPAEAGVALTALAAGHALVQYLSGRLADELSRKTVLVGGLGVAICGFGLLSVATRYPVFVAGTSLVGLGGGGFIIAMRISLSDLFVARRGQALGMNLAAGQLGNVLAAGLAVVALAVATWRAAFLPVIGLILLVVVALQVWAHDQYAVGRVDLGVGETARRILATRRIRWLLVAYTLVIFTWQGVVGFLPTLLQVDKGFSAAFASGGFALLFLIGMIAQPLAGGLSDRLPRPVVAGGALLFGVAGLAVISVVAAPILIAVGIALLAVGLMSFPPVTQAYLLDIFPDATVGGDFGAFRTIYQVVASLGPTYVGVVAERATFTAAFAGFGVCMLGSAVILLVVVSPD